MISDLKKKLSGELPVTRIELIELVSSWGRLDSFFSIDGIAIHKCESNECYPLENLDVSKIINFSYIFIGSLYNEDLSKWNLSSCLDMSLMFCNSEFNNNSLKDWNVSNVESMKSIFLESKFNGDISNWDIFKVSNFCYAFDNSYFDGDISKWKFNKDVNCNYIFYGNNKFENKYNNDKELSNYTNEFLEWFEANRINISNANITKDELNDIDDYLISFNEIHKDIL